MSKIDLETKIEGLKKAIAEHKDFTGTYESQLKQAEQDLKDLGKPELTPSQLDDIYEAVEKGVSEFDFSDTDNFDKEFNIDYDNRIQLENFDFTNHTDLVEMIVEKVSKLFVEAECPEDELDTTEVDNHA
jgi:beta-glucanase (GH16 family)